MGISDDSWNILKYTLHQNFSTNEKYIGDAGYEDNCNNFFRKYGQRLKHFIKGNKLPIFPV